jgi:signal transduction histidine kinase
VAFALDMVRLYEAERAARAEAEELVRQLQAERDRLQQVLDALPVGVVIVDAQGRVETLNRAGLDIVGTDTRGQSLPAPGAEVAPEYRVSRPDGTPYPPEEVPLRRSLLFGEEVRDDQQLHRHALTGRTTPLLVNSAPLRDPAGAIVGAVATFQDISALRELERTREAFLSSAAHDLKNPLTSIRGQAQLARRRLTRLDSPETAQVLVQFARIQEGADAMLDLINELVDVTRQQMGVGLDLHRVPTDLVALVQDCIEIHRDESGRPIHLEAAVPELMADVDAARIGRVVNNLLSNAIKYSPAKSAITIHLRSEEGAAGPQVVLAVQDQGMGIPAADLPHIFDRFRRAGNVVGHIQGTGIGLASARGIVEQHEGTIAVESTEGVGSTFTVRLPLAAP